MRTRYKLFLRIRKRAGIYLILSLSPAEPPEKEAGLQAAIEIRNPKLKIVHQSLYNISFLAEKIMCSRTGIQEVYLIFTPKFLPAIIIMIRTQARAVCCSLYSSAGEGEVLRRLGAAWGEAQQSVNPFPSLKS